MIENNNSEKMTTFWWVVNKTISYKLHLALGFLFFFNIFFFLALGFLISNTKEQLANKIARIKWR